MDWAHRIQPLPDLAYGPHPMQRLDLTLQVTRVGEPDFYRFHDTPAGLLVWIHGGGWIQGDKATQLNWIIPYLQRGWHVANVNYRQGPGTAPLAIDDCLLAMRWLKDNASTFNLHYDRVVVSGGSAGGHLALTTGIRSQRRGGPRVGAIVNWYGITDIEDVANYLDEARPTGNYARTWAGAMDIAKLGREHSPIQLVSSDIPPVISLHGEDDTLVPVRQAIELHNALNAANVRQQLVTMTGGNHGGFTDAQYQDAFRAVFAFLDDK